MMIREYTNREVARILGEEEREPVYLHPYLQIRRGEVLLEARIGREKRYIVKNLLEFAQAVHSGKRVEYGKGMAFEHVPSAFAPESRPFLDLLLEEADALGFRVMLTTNGTLLRQREALLLGSPAVEKVSVSVHSFEGNGGAGEDLEGYLDGCIAFARAAAGAGKRCALRLWNLDGAETEGANRQNGQILSRLREAFPGPWRSDRRGTTLAPGIYLEFGEKFQWPDLSAPEEEGRRFCYGLRDQVGVLWDGTVVPCCLDHEGDVPLGNLYETSLEEAREALCRRCAFTRRFQ